MAPTKHCDHDCKYNGAENKAGKRLDMVRCCLCMRWFHVNCLKAKDESSENIWNCFSCRMMPMQITTLLASVTQLTCALNELKDAHELSKAETTALKCEVSELKCKIAEMNNSKTFSSAAQQNRTSSTPRKSTLLIGDSIIRDVDQEKLSDTSVKCFPGATIKRVHDELQQINSAEPPSKIILVAGTNDCAKEDVTISDTIEQFSNLLSTACSKADEVVVSSVCPRLDTSWDQDHFASFNAGLQSIVKTKADVCSLITLRPLPLEMDL